jgi:hypothetical protein
VDAWLSAHPVPSFAIILGLFWLVVRVLDKAWPIVWKQTSNEGLVSKAELNECLDRLACEMDAGDERMDTGAEVGVFVATWFPVRCPTSTARPWRSRPPIYCAS